jgi:hypothetical protein
VSLAFHRGAAAIAFDQLKKREYFGIQTDLFSLSVCNKGLGFVYKVF